MIVLGAIAVLNGFPGAFIYFVGFQSCKTTTGRDGIVCVSHRAFNGSHSPHALNDFLFGMTVGAAVALASLSVMTVR